MQILLKKYLGDIVTFSYSLFIVSPSLFFYFAEKKVTSYMLLFVLLQVLILLSPVILLNMSKRIWNFLSIPFFILTLVQWANFSIFEFELTEGAILAILDTSLNESNDFLKIIPTFFWITLPLMFLLFICVMKNNFIAIKRIIHIKKIYLFLMILLILPKVLRSPHISTLEELFGKMYPTRNITTLVKSVKLRSKYLTSLENFSNTSVIAKSIHNNEVNILVIGESARKQNHSHYGYQRNTSKFTKELGVNLNTFNSVYSASNSTIMSLKNTITKTSNGSIYTLPGIMKAAGSNVTWISNQGKYGEHLSLLSMIAKTGDESIYVNNSDFGGVSYDGKVLSHLKKKLSSDGSLFIVIHLLGSHFNYIRRYPNKFEFFNDQKYPAKSIEQNNIINKYDNSILYTDYVLAEIIKVLQVEQRPTSLVYFSDHGEILYDEDYNFYGHGGGRESTKYELEVPFYTWMNDKFQTPQRIQEIKAKEIQPFSLIDFIPFYLKFVGVEVKGVPLLKIYSEHINYYNSKDELVPFIK
jgi:heptose-I-phosphate ethanolaminephosphotransferase